MKKGGYKIIDFKGTALSGTAEEITGIYEDIVNNYDKAILVSGVSLNGELQNDAYASVSYTEDTVLLTVYDGVITVTEDDEVTFTSTKTTSELAGEIGDLSNLDTAVKTDIVSAINSKVKSTSLYSPSATVHKLNIPSSSRHCLVCVSGRSDTSGSLILVGCNSSGGVNILEIGKGSGVTITTDTNELTITLTAANLLSILDFAPANTDFVSLKTQS